MSSSAEQQPFISQWQDLSYRKPPDNGHIDNIKTHLDLILITLEALAGIGSEAIIQAAEKLKLESFIADRIALWRLRQSNPLRKSSGGRKKLDVEEAKALVLIICYLTKQEQELIRRAVVLLEQVSMNNQPPHQIALLGDYLDKFTNLYEARMKETGKFSHKNLTNLALKLLIDLLFYSSHNGHRRLWLALFN